MSWMIIIVALFVVFGAAIWQIIRVDSGVAPKRYKPAQFALEGTFPDDFAIAYIRASQSRFAISDPEALRQKISPELTKTVIGFEMPFIGGGVDPMRRANALRSEAIFYDDMAEAAQRDGDVQRFLGAQMTAMMFRERAKNITHKAQA